MFGKPNKLDRIESKLDEVLCMKGQPEPAFGIKVDYALSLLRELNEKADRAKNQSVCIESPSSDSIERLEAGVNRIRIDVRKLHSMMLGSGGLNSLNDKDLGDKYAELCNRCDVLISNGKALETRMKTLDKLLDGDFDQKISSIQHRVSIIRSKLKDFSESAGKWMGGDVDNGLDGCPDLDNADIKAIRNDITKLSKRLDDIKTMLESRNAMTEDGAMRVETMLLAKSISKIEDKADDLEERNKALEERINRELTALEDLRWPDSDSIAEAMLSQAWGNETLNVVRPEITKKTIPELEYPAEFVLSALKDYENGRNLLKGRLETALDMVNEIRKNCRDSLDARNYTRVTDCTNTLKTAIASLSDRSDPASLMRLSELFGKITVRKDEKNEEDIQ